MEKNAPALQLKVQPVPAVYIQYDPRSSTFRIGNELTDRRIFVDTQKRFIFTTAFTNKLSGRNYARSLSKEFSFRANGTELSGVTGDIEYVDHETFGSGGLKGLVIALRVNNEAIGSLRVNLVYEIYSHMPVIRKWIEIENPGGSSIAIDSIQVESLSLLPGSQHDVEVYADSRPSTWGAQALSPAVVDTRLAEGFLMSNESPGVLGYSDLYSDGNSVSIGMKPHFQTYATEIQLAPSEIFVSPAAFILFFKGDLNRGQEILAEFVTEYVARPGIPTESVWYENIEAEMTEQEARERMQLAARSGADVFCLGSGWASRRGDWIIEEDGFPGDLAQYAHNLELKFGLRVELAVADPGSQIVAERPEWVVKLGNGSDYTILGAEGEKMMCLGSEYALHAAYGINRLIEELDLDYVKLTGPIIPDPEAGGCFAEDHVHRSGGESLWYIYEGLFAVCRYLHSQHPDLIIDVSPESYHPGGKIDYALLKYADVAWPF